MNAVYTRIANTNYISRGAIPASPRRSTRLYRYYYPTDGKNEANKQQQPREDKPQGDEDQGAMSRRLSDMTEQTMMEGGRSTQRDMNQAGFSDELKRRLEERIAAGSSFRNDFAAAHSLVNHMPVMHPFRPPLVVHTNEVGMQSSAGQGTRETAAAPAWQGTETLHDSALRMLDDSKKPIRFKPRLVDTPPVRFERSPRPPKSPGLRIARAKDKMSAYTQSQSEGISEKERASLRRELEDRFTPGFSASPLSIHGLSSLANERIEDAIAGGHFKAIPRGKGVNVEPDRTASNAFLDTTEYLMNKMVKRQDLVPPWIEKQQELFREVSKFRERLRVEWRRHAARLVASKGGSLEAQMRRAHGHAAAESRLAERARTEALFRDAAAAGDDGTTSVEELIDTGDIPYLPPLRDENYLSIERSFHELTIKHLNSLTRSYNLQAPPVAQKPYLRLDRELAACFADVAPTLADEIKRRATERARPTPTAPSSRSPGLLGTLGVGHSARIYDEDKSKGYGFRELFRDVFSSKSNGNRA